MGGGQKSSEVWKTIKSNKTNFINKVNIQSAEEEELVKYFTDLLKEKRPEFMDERKLSNGEYIQLTTEEINRAIESTKLKR